MKTATGFLSAGVRAVTFLPSASSASTCSLHRLELAAQRRQEHRLDEPHDRRAVGVVGAELGALARVEAALEERAEDGGLDLRPVEAGDRSTSAISSRVSGSTSPLSKRPPLNHSMRSAPNSPPCSDILREQLAEPVGEDGRVVACRRGQATQQAGGQQAGILGEHAEEELVEEVGDVVRLVAAAAQALGERGEVLRCLGGQLVSCLAGPQLLGMLHDGPQQPQRLGRVGEEIVEVERVDDRGRVREVGVDLEAVEVADDEQRRVLEGLPVLQELVVGGLQVLALALVLPGEVAALPDVGEAVAAARSSRRPSRRRTRRRSGRPRWASARRACGRGR